IPGPLHRALERAREAAARADAADLRTRSYARFIGAVACRDMGRFEEAVEEFDIGVKLFATAAEGHEPGLVYPIFVSLCGWRAESSISSAASSGRRARSYSGHVSARCRPRSISPRGVPTRPGRSSRAVWPT